MQLCRYVLVALALGAFWAWGCGDGPSQPDDKSSQPCELPSNPSLRQLCYDEVIPGSLADYWELRYKGSGTPSQFIGSGGSKNRDQLNESVVDSLDSIAERQWKGSGPPCGPSFCSYFVLVVLDDEIAIVNTVPDLKAFLGVNNETEGLFLVFSRGYYSGDEEEPDPIWQISEGYEAIVLERVNDCPIRVDKVLLRIYSESSAVEVIEREVWAEDLGCI